METSRWMCGAVVVLVLAGCGAPPAPVSSSAPTPDKKKAELVEQSIVPPSSAIQLGKGWPREDVNVVTGSLPLACEVRGVDPLASAEHVSAIREQCNAQGRVPGA